MPSCKASRFSNAIFHAIFFSAILFSGSKLAAADGGLGDDFYNGNTRLEYRFFATKGAAGSAELRKLYDQGKWEELVRSVIDKSYVVDTYYFYLGRAAEELGAPKAAQIYFKLSAESSLSYLNKCTNGGLWNSCAGFNVQEEVQKKLVAAINKTGKERRWGAGDGPHVEVLVKTKPSSIEQILKAGVAEEESRRKSKFETEQEYKARVGRNHPEYFVVKRLVTDESGKCPASYEHERQVYRVDQCLAVTDKDPFSKQIESGDSFVLANMVDKRKIERNLVKTYFLNANFVWSEALSITRDEAKSLDSDLMVGVVFKGFEKEESCSLCQQRKNNEALERFVNLANEVSKIKSTSAGSASFDSDWKNLAFKEGFIVENWDYRITPEKIKRFVVFRGSNFRVVYDIYFDD